MTPKEKAEELVNKMYGVTDYQAKQSALIAVEEILNGSRLFYIEDYDYWQEVKNEINKL